MKVKIIACSFAAAMLFSPFSARADITAGGALGAVAGGLLGSQVGQGNGRVAASALGAVIGYDAGQSMSQPERFMRQPGRVYAAPYREDEDEYRHYRREDDDDD